MCMSKLKLSTSCLTVPVAHSLLLPIWSACAWPASAGMLSHSMIAGILALRLLENCFDRSPAMPCFYLGPSAEAYCGLAHARSAAVSLLGNGLGNARVSHSEPAGRAPLTLGLASAA